MVEPGADDFTRVVDDHTADPGVRGRGPAPLLAQRDRSGDQLAVRAVHEHTSIATVSAETPRRGDGAAGTQRRAAEHPLPSGLSPSAPASPGQPHGWRPWARGLPQVSPAATAGRDLHP